MKYLLMLLAALLSFAGIAGIDQLFLNWPALVVGTVTLVAFIKAQTGIKDIVALIVSWGVGATLVVVGYIASLGFLAGIQVWEMVVVAICTSAASNGFYKAGYWILVALNIIEPEPDVA
jgi:hypothetical protein